jgi:hypothetical protein
MGKLHNSIVGVEVEGQFKFSHLDLCRCNTTELDHNGNHRVILSPATKE